MSIAAIFITSTKTEVIPSSQFVCRSVIFCARLLQMQSVDFIETWCLWLGLPIGRTDRLLVV